MARFVVRRVLVMVLVLFAISLVTFAIFEAIPSDPAVRLAGRHANPAQIPRWRRSTASTSPSTSSTCAR